MLSFNDVKNYILDRANEDNDGTSDFESSCTQIITEAWRWLYTLGQWLCLRKYPPGVIITAAPVTGLTITTTFGSTAATLSAPPPASLSVANYIVVVAGKNYAIRVTAHTGGLAAITIDGVPESLAGVAVTLVKTEYDLPANCGILTDGGLWTEDGDIVTLEREEQARWYYDGPPDISWPPSTCVRITKGKVRLSTAPDRAHRLEFPYQDEPAEPTGSTTMVIDRHLIPVLAEKSLSVLYEMKDDSRAKNAEARALEGVIHATAYEQLLKNGTGDVALRKRASPYGN